MYTEIAVDSLGFTEEQQILLPLLLSKKMMCESLVNKKATSVSGPLVDVFPDCSGTLVSVCKYVFMARETIGELGSTKQSVRNSTDDD